MSIGVTFNGSTSKLTTDLTSHSATLSIFAWIRPVSAGSLSLGRIFDKRTGATQVELAYVTSTNNLSFNRDWNSGASSVGWNSDNGTVPFGTWRAIGITYDSSLNTNNAILYLNGTAVSVTQVGADPSGSADTNADPFVIGNRGNDDARGFDGDMAIFGFWDRILTASEMTSLAAGAEPTLMATSLLRYYRMDQGSANEPDLAGIGGSATATNLTASATSPEPFLGARYRRIAGPRQLAATAETLYTVPTGMKAELRSVDLNNPSGSAVDVTMLIGEEDTARVGTDTVLEQLLTLNRGQQAASRYTPAQSGQIYQISSYVAGQAGTNALFTQDIYADNGLGTQPGALLASSADVLITTSQPVSWVTAPISLPVTAGTYYWLCPRLQNAGASGIDYYNGALAAGKVGHFTSQSNPATGWSLYSDLRGISIYADSTTGARVLDEVSIPAGGSLNLRRGINHTLTAGETLQGFTEGIAKVGEIGTAAEQAASTTHAITVGANQGAVGNLVVLRFSYHHATATISSIVDSRGNTYLFPASLTQSGSPNNVTAAIAYSILGTALQNGDTITITLSASCSLGFYAAEFSGIASTSPLDQTGETSTSVAANPWSVVAGGATSQADELLVSITAGAIGSAALSSTPTSPWIEEFDDLGTIDNRIVAQYQIVSAIGTYTSAGTYASTGDSGPKALATFKAAAPPVITVNANIEEL